MKTSILLIDNIDSFTFNVVQALTELGARVEVRRSDELSLEQARALQPSHLVIGPGPGRPEAATRALDIARAFFGRCPILGICLGHQMLGLLGGARVVAAQEPAHGKPLRIYHDGRMPFRGLPNPFEGARYNSLVVAPEELGAEFEISAWSSEGEVLGLRHRELPILGFQCHPEGIMTRQGEQLLRQFLALGEPVHSPGSLQA